MKLLKFTTRRGTLFTSHLYYESVSRYRIRTGRYYTIIRVWRFALYLGRIQNFYPHKKTEPGNL